MYIFKNRQQAGQILAHKLVKHKNEPNGLVLAIPRGGVVVARQIADNLNLPMDLVITRKLTHPTQTELALGAIDSEGQVVWEENLINQTGIQKIDLLNQVEEAENEIKRRQSIYGQKKLEISGKTIILVDDGVATGSTAISAINFLKRHDAEKVVFASPVASQEALKIISPLVEEMLVLHTPAVFEAVGQFYRHFETVEDESVLQYLR